MSGTSPRPPSSPGGPTRALAFIKNHALKHRLTIERRITDAGFDIVKERQMEFSPESDREVLEELFGNDSAGIGERSKATSYKLVSSVIPLEPVIAFNGSNHDYSAPVWVYVLERNRAIETLASLMGSEDPEEARQNEPQSLRAVYGLDYVDNAIGGSIDSAAAEAQIAALFASSPPFPTSELPLEDEQGGGTMRSVSSSVLDEIRYQLDQQTDAAYYASSVLSNGGSQPSSSGTPTSGKKPNVTPAHGKSVFRARAVPATNVPGSVQPRMTKAAALRMGLAPPEPAFTRARGSSTGEIVGKRDFIDTPGHKRSTAIKVASTAAPTIAPRATKASSLREGKPVELQRRQSLDIPRSEMFRNVPGHKRTETVEVASVKEPIVKPRTNRSASLRQTKETAPPSSFMFKGPTAPPLATRRSSSSLKNEEYENKPAPARRASIGARPSSAQLVRPPSVGPPEVAPRTNRSAMLRAAKMNATQSKATRA